MEKLIKIISKSSLKKVFLFWFLVAFSISFTATMILDASSEQFNGNIFAHIVMGGFVGFSMSLLATFMESSSRKSDLFWEQFKEVEEKIENTEKLDELKSILNTDIDKLMKMSFVIGHKQSIIRLIAIIKTKAKYVKE